jgi:thioesterase domain-containing protein/acyl carrier protein
MSSVRLESRGTAVGRSRADIGAWIGAELARALKVDPLSIDATAPLYMLGVDSLTAITLTGLLAEWLQRDIPVTLMWDHGSIDAIAQALADPAAIAPPFGVVPLQPHGNRPALFCFPGTSGHCVHFAPLAASLGLDQPCFGLTAPGADGEHPPLEKIEDIAAAILPKIRLVQPKGPYQFAGFSFGGLLAFEAAQQLRMQGDKASVLALFDTFTPQGHMSRPRWQRLALHAYILTIRAGRIEHVRRHLQGRRDRLQAARARERPATTDIEAREKILLELERVHRRAARMYRPQQYGEELLLFRATERSAEMVFSRVEKQTNGWGALAAERVRIVDFPGTHTSIVGPANAAKAAELLRPYLANDPTGAAARIDSISRNSH